MTTITPKLKIPTHFIKHLKTFPLFCLIKIYFYPITISSEFIVYIFSCFSIDYLKQVEN